ncbi:MAG: DNA polymerase V family protein [Actinomycetota bacterium]|nr:DNA polymerase V family protein [Actinomycetota bacterium]
MLEQLYTRKVIVALMAVIFAANGWLLYQLWYEPSTVDTADAPTSESPRNPATPPDGEGIEDETEDEAGDETEDEASADEDEEDAQSEDADGTGESGAGGPSSEGAGGEAPDGDAETPFSSQYDPPPTAPGSPVGGSEFGSSGFGSPEFGAGDFDPGGAGDFDPGASGSEGGVSRIRTVIMSALLDVGDDGSGGAASEGEGSGSGMEALPTTSGFRVLPGVVVVAAAFGAAVFILRRR